MGSLLASLTACSEGDVAEDSGVHVITSVYPLEWLASQVGGEDVTVTNLTPAGADPHEVELSPRQVGMVADADIVFYIPGLQPAIDEAVEQHAADHSLDSTEVVDLLPVSTAEHEHHDHDEEGQDHDEEGHDHDEEGHDAEDSHSHGGMDPHLWLDPERLADLAEALADRLSDVDPDHAAVYQENRDTVVNELTELHTAYSEGLATCSRRELVVSHAAFGYLAEAHDLEQISITSVDSHEEPSPAQIAEVVHEVEEHDVTTIFTTPLTDPSIAETVAAETGAEVAILDPMGSLTDESPGTDYLSIMRANLDALTAALDCS